MDLIISHSHKAMALWKEQTGQPMSSYSKARHWEIYNHVLQQFGDVDLFLKQHDDIGPNTRSKHLNIVSDPLTLILLKIELVAMVDIGSYFVNGTYNLEGDGVLAVKCYEKIRNAIHTKHYHNPGCGSLYTLLTVNLKSPQILTAAIQQQLVDYSISCVHPGLLYFNEKFGNDDVHPMVTFKVARFFYPIVTMEIQPTAADIDALSVFPFPSKYRRVS